MTKSLQFNRLEIYKKEKTTSKQNTVVEANHSISANDVVY